MDRATKLIDDVRSVLKAMRVYRAGPRQRFTDATVILVLYWSIVNNKPRKWACDAERWPRKLPPGGLPSPSQLSRRLRVPRMQALLDRVEARVRAIDPTPPTDVILIVDGRALPIGPDSRDPHAGYGRASSGKAKGYKLHAIIDDRGHLVAWRLAPMNTDEREMARRMLRGIVHSGYLLADSNYDSNKLFALAESRGVQMLVPRRYGADKAFRPARNTAARARSRELLESAVDDFGPQLHARRARIERVFGTAASTPELLNGLPAWVRRRDRVYRWVQAKLVLAELHRLDLAQNRAA